jgi:guanylate kinase
MSSPERGRLLVLAAPSGAGKTSLVHALLGRLPDLKFSVSYTTRPARSSEEDGRDYQFVSPARFERMVADGEFLEYANVFGHWYGTGRRHVEDQLDQGLTVLLEIDWQGARQVRESAPAAISIFILPPSVQELERRLRGRGTDSEETIRRRLSEAVDDMHHWSEFDYALVNDDLGRTADALEAIARGRGAADHRTDSPALAAKVAEILGGA